jgi:hypothetical protein
MFDNGINTDYLLSSYIVQTKQKMTMFNVSLIVMTLA